MTTENTIQDRLEGATISESRALFELGEAADRPHPMTSEAAVAAIVGEGRWADFFGISDEELDDTARAAAILLDRGNREDAKKLLEYLTSMDPFKAATHIQLGAVALDEENFDHAIARFTLAILFFGGDLGAYAGRALALLQSGNAELAQADVDKALELDPDGENPLTMRLATFVTSRQS